MSGSPWRESEGAYDLACQIPVLRCVWADLDYCTVEDARERVRKAGLPVPTIIVRSGNGVHLYWVLSETEVVPAFTGATFKAKDGKGRVTDYHFVNGEKVSGKPPMSERGDYLTRVVAGLAKAIGGDSTHDLSRILIHDPGDAVYSDLGRTPDPSEDRP